MTIRNPFKRRSKTGETEAIVAETTKDGSPASVNPDVSKLVSEAVAAALAPITQQLGGLAKSQKEFADSYAAEKAAAAEAEKAAEAAKAAAATSTGKAGEPKAVTADEVAKLVDDRIKAGLTAHTATAAQASLREKAVADLTAKGVPPEIIAANLAEAKDEAGFTAAGQKAIARWNELGARTLPNSTTTQGQGGTVPGAGGGAVTPAAMPGLSPGESAFAAGIKLPAH